MPRRATLVILLALCACRATPAPAPRPETPPPNVVLIISDDQAWSDFGFMGHPVIRTPNLDRLAARSAVFPRGYVPSSLCRPSLATIITGLYPHQHRITGNDPPPGVARDRMLAHIAAVETLPRLLAPSGYRSLQTGKWWEGNCQCGGFDAGMTHGEPARGGRHGDEGLRIGRETMQPLFDFIDASAGSPFFLWYAPMLPHTPHDPPERILARYRTDGRSEHIAKYYAMCEWFDETCGQLLDHLEARGHVDETLVLFVVDNGWIQRTDQGGYAARSKRSPYEGGVRTPILVAWPGHVTPGRCAALASSVDLAPTILRAAGVAVPTTLPGTDLIGLAAGAAPVRPAVFGAIFTHDVVDIDDPTQSLLHRWLVSDRWKLIVPNRREADAQLFDVLADPDEEHDLAPRHPDRVRELRVELDRWWRARN